MKDVLVKLGSFTGSFAKHRRHSDIGQAPANTKLSDPSQDGVVVEQVASLKAAEEREARLASVQPLCMDTTFLDCFQSQSVSVEDKVKAFRLLIHSGLQNIVIAAFVNGGNPNLFFLQALRSQHLIDERCWAVSELFDANGSELPGQDLPLGLSRMLEFSVQNAMLDCDVGAAAAEWGASGDSSSGSSFQDLCALLESRCRWVAANLVCGRPQPPACWLRLRGWERAMQVAPTRLLALVRWLGCLPPGVRPGGLVLHMGAPQLPSTASARVAAIRRVMRAAGWAAQQE
ncbi:hypothetical protein Agub_g6315, partial [Astrephomene gubernaculifera]